MHGTSARVYPAGYGTVEPVANYRPMDVDSAFLRIWEVARENTLVDIYRLYELWELVEQAVVHPGDLLEVGVWRGGSAAVIGTRAAECAPGKTLYLADTFTGVVKAGQDDPYYRGGEHADTALATVSDFLHNAGLTEFRLLSGVFPEETGVHVPATHVCFCHIDVDVYQSAKDIFEWLMPRLVIGGIVVFDDYGFLGCEGVTKLVHELRNRRGVAVVANTNGHAVVIRTHE